MSDLSEFLLARIAEDEAVARDAISHDRPGMHWHWVTRDTDVPVKAGDMGEAIGYQSVSLRSVEEFATMYVGPLPAFVVPEVDEFETPGAADHIARWDPARVLAECEAKRKIVAFHESWPVLVLTEPALEIAPEAWMVKMTSEIAWQTNAEYVKRFGTDPPTAPMLLAMAQVYADHPDYREEWRP